MQYILESIIKKPNIRYVHYRMLEDAIVLLRMNKPLPQYLARDVERIMEQYA